MQGWRRYQEDAHNCLPEFDPAKSAALFAVYDGHGGADVAKYCSLHLPEFVRERADYGQESIDPPKLLKEAFVDFDATLRNPEVKAELKSIANPDFGSQSEDDEEEEAEELEALHEEADKPLEAVLERYGGEENLPEIVQGLLKKMRRKKGECGTSRDIYEDDNATATDKPKEEATTTVNSESSVPKEASTKDNEDVSTATPTEAVPNDVVKDGADSENDDEDTDYQDVEESSDEDSDDEDDDEDDDDDDDDEEDLDCRYFPGNQIESNKNEDDGEGEENYISRKGIDDSEPGVDSGTTACVAFLLPVVSPSGEAAANRVRLYVANAGDSRAVLCRGRAAVELSIDHKPEDADEKARIVAAGGTVTADGRVNDGLNLSRAIGDHVYKWRADLALADQMISALPDVTSTELVPLADEFLVIACDGIWNSMSSQEVVDFVYDRLHPSDGVTSPASDAKGDHEKSEMPDLTKICEELFDACLSPNTNGDGTGCDNMTCIIVCFNDLESLAKTATTKIISPSMPANPTAGNIQFRKRPVPQDTATDSVLLHNGEDAQTNNVAVGLSDQPPSQKKAKSDGVVAANGSS